MSRNDDQTQPGKASETAPASKGETRRRLKRAVARTAPKIAGQLGGPLAGAAVEALARAIFGKDTVPEEAIAEALDVASADTILALKRAENEFAIALREAAVEEQRIDAGDRASARERQQKMDDMTPSVLGALIIAGFFLTLGVMVARRLPVGAETEFSIMLGALATMTAAVVNYFFGSSAGSREKTKLLSEKGKAGE
ncbi:MAG: hypothetical protein ACKVS5_07025 [Parvularculaceae bacterium]